MILTIIKVSQIYAILMIILHINKEFRILQEEAISLAKVLEL